MNIEMTPTTGRVIRRSALLASMILPGLAGCNDQYRDAGAINLSASKAKAEELGVSKGRSEPTKPKKRQRPKVAAQPLARATER